MNYRGVVIEESLQDISVLKSIKILSTKVEPITPRHKTPWVLQWTLRTVEVPEEKADEIAQTISKSLDTKHEHSWYADFKNEKHHYIIFPNKIFKVDLKNPKLYKNAREYGISIGIPQYQVAFAPEI